MSYGVSYSLTDIVVDGALRGPRWVLHLVKVAQHAAPAFGLWCLLGRPLLAAVIAGPIVYAFILLRKMWNNGAHGLGRFIVVHLADWTNDGALATLPVAGAFIALGDWLGGSLLFAGCIAAWLTLHERATP